ncbi:MAG: SLC13 family permease, partial [Gammaproteobacteria bacterium]|nr:SLC13 family permease [Gammaproteobacteria bacterium]
MINEKKSYGIYLGALIFVVVLLIPTPAGMNESAHIVAATTLLMATWWISEALPFAITALIPVCFFPLFGVMDVGQVTPAYANHIVFLFLSGFIFALCIERWQLHQRIALHAINFFGFSHRKILLGIMVSTAFLSMWVSNTATVLMMIPVVVAVAKQLSPTSPSLVLSNQSSFSVSLLLGVAYSASIGGVATLIGTPPNAILAGMLEQQTGIEISFYDWMVFALPLASIFLLLTWLYLSWHMRNASTAELLLGKEVLVNELKKLAPLSYEEKFVASVFLTVCFLWIVRGFIDIELLKNINDSTIGLIGAVILFVIPARNGSERLM